MECFFCPRPQAALYREDVHLPSVRKEAVEVVVEGVWGAQVCRL